MDDGLYDEIPRLHAAGIPFVLAIVTAVRGSTPQDAGARMLVTDSGLHAGTVGGGRIEAAALVHAREMLDRRTATSTVEWNLQRDIGMTCGGVMHLYFELHSRSAWTIVIFGAGHVVQALLPVLAPLPCRIQCYDPRTEWLARLPTATNVQLIELPAPADAVADLPADAFVLLITQGHATDLPILQRCLETRNFPYLGVIGSQSKRATLERDLRAAGLPPEKQSAFECPIGLRIGSNHPHEIALSIAAGLLAARDRLRTSADDQSPA